MKKKKIPSNFPAQISLKILVKTWLSVIQKTKKAHPFTDHPHLCPSLPQTQWTENLWHNAPFADFLILFNMFSPAQPEQQQN